MSDQYLSFISPSPQLFSLVPPPPPPASANGPPQASHSATPTSYHILNSPQTTEQEIEAEIERIASGLFSVVVTSGQQIWKLSEIRIFMRMCPRRSRPIHSLPEGECGRDGRKEARAKDSGCDHRLFAFPYFLDFVCSRFHRAIQPPATLYVCIMFPSFPSLSLQCGLVLLILDRNIDLVPMISHGWTYQALVSDCLDMKLNRVIITQPQKRSYDLDSKDFFWAKNASEPFPHVAEDIDSELNKYKQDAAEITRSTGVSDVSDISQM